MTREARKEIKNFKENLKKYKKITNIMNADKFVLNNPEGRNKDILEIAKESVQEMEKETTELAKEIAYSLYLLIQYEKVELHFEEPKKEK